MGRRARIQKPKANQRVQRTQHLKYGNAAGPHRKRHRNDDAEIPEEDLDFFDWLEDTNADSEE